MSNSLCIAFWSVLESFYVKMFHLINHYKLQLDITKPIFSVALGDFKSKDCVSWSGWVQPNYRDRDSFFISSERQCIKILTIYTRSGDAVLAWGIEPTSGHKPHCHHTLPIHTTTIFQSYWGAGLFHTGKSTSALPKVCLPKNLGTASLDTDALADHVGLFWGKVLSMLCLCSNWLGGATVNRGFVNRPGRCEAFSSNPNIRKPFQSSCLMPTSGSSQRGGWDGSAL